MTVDSLKDCNKKELARIAKDRGIVGWHAMRKDQLIRALAPAPPATKAEAAARKAATTAVKPAQPVTKVKTSSGDRRPLPATPSDTEAAFAAVAVPPPSSSSKSSHAHDLVRRPPRSLDHGCGKDRIVTMVRDPFWLHTYWELSRTTLSRAQAAMGQDWHAARPILRLMDVSSEDTTAASERHIRDIEIHGGVNNWYIDVSAPPRSFRVDIGYLSKRGKFFVLARSNVVTTPKAGVNDVLDQNWFSVQEQVHRLYQQAQNGEDSIVARELRELFEERMRRPIHSLSLQAQGLTGLGGLGRAFHFEVDAELIVYGSTEPGARVTLQGEPVQIRPDGTFTVRFSLPDSRQIIPAVAASADGIEERTIVLAVERNTKELEPQIHDGNEL